jgi:hypothetical protein
MKIEIIKDGVLQPMELFIAIFYLVLIVVFVLLVYVSIDLALDNFPEARTELEKPAPMWSIFLLWLVILCRTNRD